MSTEVPGDFSLRPFLAINRNFLTNSKISIGDTLFDHAQSFYCWHTWFKKSQSKEKSFYHLQVMMQIARYGLLTHKEEARALLQLLELQEKLFNSELHTSQISIETENYKGTYDKILWCNDNLAAIGEVGDGFKRALYSTFLSFLDKKDFSYKLDVNKDKRGIFVEVLKTKNSGQFSFLTAKPGITRGQHYHHSKNEKFIVCKGEAEFSFKNLLNDDFSSNVPVGLFGLAIKTILVLSFIFFSILPKSYPLFESTGTQFIFPPNASA